LICFSTKTARSDALAAGLAAADSGRMRKSVLHLLAASCYRPAKPDTATRAMKSKIQALGRIKKEFPPRGNLQLFQLESPATFTCAVRKVEVTSAKVALNLQTGDLLSNGAYGQLIANQ